MRLGHLEGEVQALAPAARGEAAQGRDLAGIGILDLEAVRADRLHSTPHCAGRGTLVPRRRDADPAMFQRPYCTGQSAEHVNTRLLSGLKSGVSGAREIL